MNAKARKIYAKMRKMKLDSLLVTSSSNISYLTGWRIDYGCVILYKKALYFFTDKRYSEMAKKNSAGRFAVITVKENLIKTIKEFLLQNHINDLGFEAANLKFNFYDKLRHDLPQVKLIGTNDIIESVRAVKDIAELKNIKKAVKISDQAFCFILKYIRANFSKKITENNIAWELEKYIRDNGGENASFEMIVASGKNSSVPHHQTGDQIIKKGDMVIIDFGAVVGGYRSDLTRTIFVGHPSGWQAKIYKAVLKVQMDIIRKAHQDVTGQALDQRAHNIFKKMGYENNFLHGLGHGVGLDIHELPFINKYRSGNDLKIKANMIFTIEPGLYFSGRGGVRIEDMVWVTAGGCQILSKAPKGLEEMIIEV